MNNKKTKYSAYGIICFVILMSIILIRQYSSQFTSNKNPKLTENKFAEKHVIKLPEKLRPLLLETNGRENEKFYINKNTDGTFSAKSESQRIISTFDQNGVIIRPASRFDAHWLLGLEFSRIGYSGHLNLVKNPRIFSNKNQISYMRTGNAEWYVNKPQGLEQGFTVYDRPSGKKINNYNLEIEIGYTTELKPLLSESKNEIAWINNHGTEVFKYQKLLAFDSNRNILPSYLTVSDNKISIHVDDKNAVYPIVIDPILIQETLIYAPSDPDIFAKYGQSVAIDGSVAVVGSPGDNDNGDLSGSAYIHLKDQGGPNNWGEFLKITPTGASPCDLFGYSVDVSGDIIAVGANTVTTTSSCPADAGVVYLFQKDAGGVDNWGQIKQITASDSSVGNQFGFSVALDGDTLIVGAPGDSGEKGAAYVFGKDQGGVDNWGEVTKITSSDGVVDDLFGYDVSVNADSVVVGAPAHYSGGIFASGAAYIYYRDQGGADNWGEVTQIAASDAAEGDIFGTSVSIDGDTVSVGASAEDNTATDAGAVYFYGRNIGGADAWGQDTKLTAGDAQDFDALGSAMVVQSNLMLTGAPGDDDAGNSSGAFYGSEFDGSSWGALEKFTASDAGPGTGLKGLGVFEIDNTTGDRSIVADNTIGTNLFSEPEGIAVLNPGVSEEYLVADKGVPAIISVDPTTGTQSVLEDNSGSPSIPFVLPVDLDIDSGDNLFITDPGNASVIRIDSVTGNRSFVNDIFGGYPALGFPLGIAVESSSGNVVVTDLQMIIASGTQECYDCASDPDCIPPDCFQFGCVGCEDIINPGVARINSSTGNVTVLADTTSCIGGRSFNRPLGIVVLPSNNFAVAAIDLNESTAVIEDWAILGINSTTGACSIISDSTTGTGPDLEFPEGIELLGSNLVVVDNLLKEIIEIDPGTGNRTVLSGGVTGTGPEFQEPFWLAINGAGDPVITDQGTTGINFGTSIDISGSTAIIGAPGKSNLQGGMYIFQFCEEASPAVLVSPATQTATAGSSVDYDVNIQNVSNLACPMTTFDLSAQAPAQFNSVFTPSSVNLNSGQSADVTWSVTSDASTVESSYELSAEVTNSGEPVYTNTGNATYTVTTNSSTCGNDICEAGEDCSTCSVDCISGSGASCGNGICEAGDGEDCVSCPQDCAGKQNGKPSGRYCCGDGDGQNPLSCSNQLCGASCTDVPAIPSCCGDTVCGGIEDSFNCEIDCGSPPICGDAVCNGTEDSCTCPGDCGAPPADETAFCTDGLDNDCDGNTDCNDNDCSSDTSCQCVPTHNNEKGPRCSDGIDNDCDGLIDGADPDC